MKKLSILFAVAIICAVSFTSCNDNSAKKPILRTQLDSLNYAFGLTNGDGLRKYRLQNDIMEDPLDEFFKGLNDGLNSKSDNNPELDRVIIQFGSALKQQSESGLMGDSTLTFDYKLIRQGLINGIKGADFQMTVDEANEYFETTMMALQAKQMEEQAKQIEEQYKENKLAGEAFLAENAKNPNVVTTESGLQYKIVKKGKGKIPTETSTVKVHYHGTLIDGTVFDSSIERDKPISFGVLGVIRGWTEALQLMPVGSKWTLYIPQELAYGASGQGAIVPFSALIFDVELIAIED